MFGKLVISLFVLFVVLHQIDGSCFLYPCDDLISDAKCVNTTDYWVTKSNLTKAKYCECCMNGIIKPGMQMYPNANGTTGFNSTFTNSTRSFNSTRPSYSTGQPAFNSSTRSQDLENTLHSSRKNFNYHDSKNVSKIKILKSNSTRPAKKPEDNSIPKNFGLH